MTGNTAVQFSYDQGIARIRFNRPQALNAIDETVARELLALCRAIQARDDVRVVILCGAGKAFMAGGDLARFHADLPAAPDTAQAIIEPLHAALLILAGLPAPVIASVQGAAAGAGMSIVLACDLAMAAADARFSVGYPRIGASPDGSMTWSLPRAVGMRKAMEIVLMGEVLDAGQALQAGIVNRVVANDALEAETDALARHFAQGPSVAYGKAKQLLRASLNHTLAEQLQAEEAAFRACAATSDFREGIGAFFDKRKPEFTGT
jgi:2-(1,2-epoxy-1,2-dihydrophenyl)acetyl-CoA isomerase